MESVTFNEHRNMNNPSGAQRQSEGEGRAEKHRSRCLLIMTVSLGLLCVLLLVIIILQHFIIIPERNMKKCTDEDLQRTQFCLPGHHTPPLRQEPTTKTTAKPPIKSTAEPTIKAWRTERDTHVFSRSGETVHLPCRNTDQYCRTSGTTWNYMVLGYIPDELIALGENKANPEKHERVNLGSDCSLIISRVTTEDAGLYTCTQWKGDQKHGHDARVFLHVVAVSVSPSSSSSSSSSSSDIGPGLSLTLSCRLFSYSGFSCDGLFSSEDLRLSWVNEAGVDLNTDSRYQISSTGCIISLSTTLISEDEDKQWRCGVYQRNQLKTSDTFTVHYSAQTTTTITTEVTPVHNTNSTISLYSIFSTVLSVLLSAAALAVFIAAVLCLIQRRRRAGGNAEASN